VDISEPEEEIDVQSNIDNLKKLEREKDEIELQVYKSKRVGF
jgi:restriction endonuclease S subunit